MNLHRPAWYVLVCNHTVHFRLYIIHSFGTESTHDTIIIVKNGHVNKEVGLCPDILCLCAYVHIVCTCAFVFCACMSVYACVVLLAAGMAGGSCQVGTTLAWVIF